MQPAASYCGDGGSHLLIRNRQSLADSEVRPQFAKVNPLLLKLRYQRGSRAVPFPIDCTSKLLGVPKVRFRFYLDVENVIRVCEKIC